MDAETIYLLGVRDALIIAGMDKIDATAAVVRSASVLAATAELHV